MIEVEKKFRLDDVGKSRLLQDAKFLGEVTISDTYYDIADYQLTRSNRWLRKRNGNFELKIPIAGDKPHSKLVTRYREIDTEADIREALGIIPRKSLGEDLAADGYKSYASWVNTRKKYSKEGFSIDVDSLDFGYEVVEIELMANNPAEAEEAEQKIMDFAKKHGLSTEHIFGKNSEYLRRFRPDHFTLLIEAGVIKPPQAV